MSGYQHQHHGYDQDSQPLFPLDPLDVPQGIVRQILRARLDTWDVRVTNQRTGRVKNRAYRTRSFQEAVERAFHQVTDHDPDGAYDPYDICATLVDGPRKLWDVTPLEQSQIQASPDRREPPLIGRVVSVDEDGAIETAIAAFQLKEGQFCVRQV